MVDAYNNDASKATYVEYLSLMTDYSLRHFRDEEALMEKMKFDNFEAHVSEHKTFIYEVAMFNLLYEEMDKSGILKMIIFLKEWWLNHVIKFDMEIKFYIE
jgi:hemerythrin